MTISIGTRVNCILHWAGRGVVFAIHGEQRPETVRRIGGGVHMGGGARFDVVFENGAISRAVPESIVRSVQWSILPEIATETEIAAALAHAAHVTAEKEKAGAEAARLLTDGIETLRGDPAY